MSKIIVPYKPRSAFLDYHNSDKRWSLTVAHRRAGKTVARINKLIRKAVECDKLNPRFGYLSPFYVQSKDIAWIYLKHYTAPIIALGGHTNESELSVTFPHNNAIIKLYGAENAERMRGLYFDGIVVDEGQGISKSVLTQIILPALADRLGWLDVSGTPKGWQNLLGELYKLAVTNDDWFCQMLKASDTGIIPDEELKRQKALMSENEYAQEFECSFDAAITGSVYGKEMAKIEVLGRMKRGLFDPSLDVYTAWDLGRTHRTAIWWWQKSMNECRLIDYYQNSGQNIEHYIEQLYGRKISILHINTETQFIEKWAFAEDMPEIAHRRKYKYAKHYVPHDAANKLLQAGGRSIVQQAHKLGVLMYIVAATSQQNSIEALKKVLEMTWIDPDNCEVGLDCMKNYHYQWDEERKIHRDIPYKDWTSDGCDAAEIIGQVWRNEVKEKEPEKLKFLHEATAKELFWPEKTRIRSERI